MPRTIKSARSTTGNTSAKNNAGNRAGAAARNSNAAKSKSKNAIGNEAGDSEEQPEYSHLLEKLFINMLKDMLWAEQHLVEALAKMQKAATTESLQDALEDHRYVTQKHAARLEKIFGLLGIPAEPKKCDAMEGLTKEAEAMMRETRDGTMTRDAALIIAAQKVEHYEIASYGSLVQIALTLDYEHIASILEKTLEEEEDTDQQLTDIAESEINPLADEEDEGIYAGDEASEMEA